MNVETLSPVRTSRPLLAPDSILPPMIVRPAANLWLWVLPLGILLALNVEGYGVIEGNMTPAQRQVAFLLGAAGIANIAAGILMFLVTRRLASDSTPVAAARWWWGLPAILCNVAYLWFAFWAVDEVLPANVMTWIYPPTRFLFNQFSFAMLPAFLGILQVACVAPAKQAGRAFGLSAAMAIGSPAAFYLFLSTANSFSDSGGGAMIFATVAVATGLVMFIGVIRCVMFMLRFAQQWSTGTAWSAIVMIALILPTAGLLLNRAIPFPVDFQAWEVYALMLANAAIVFVAAWKHTEWPRASFNLLWATLPFSLYFFVVLLPYTPLAIFAVMAMGLGFLILTPTLLFTLHIYLLHRAARALPTTQAKRVRAIAIGAICFLTLPTYFTVRALADKADLNSALAFVATPAVPATDIHYPGNRTNLHRALVNHRNYKNGIYYPLLSDFYSWLVFDNLILPDTTLAQMETLFFGAKGSTANSDPLRSAQGSWFGRSSVRDRSRALIRARPTPKTVQVGALAARVAPKGPDTVITLALTLQNTDSAPAEYIQAIPLPAGVYVTGFRLQVGDALVPGRIFEKKTAQWVYTMIRDSERRDPGLLVYTKPKEVQLSVFPVDSRRPTQVEIDFLVPQTIPVSDLSLGPKDPAHAIKWLADRLSVHAVITEQGSLVTGGLSIPNLRAVERTPYLHLIVDRSEANGFAGDLTTALNTLRTKFPTARQVRITLANYNVVDAQNALATPDAALANGKTFDRLLPRAGGFNADLALAHALRVHRDADLDHSAGAAALPPRPVFVILGRHVNAHAPELTLAENWAEACGGLELHELDESGSFVSYPNSEPSQTPLLRLGTSVRPILSGTPTIFSPTPAESHFEYWSPEATAWRPAKGIQIEEHSSAWAQTAALQIEQTEYARQPGAMRGGLGSLVRRSREAGVLLPVTSYIVVENQAQWRTLELSEKQKLGQNTALAFQEAPAPSVWIIGGGFLLFLSARAKAQKSKASRLPLPIRRRERNSAVL